MQKLIKSKAVQRTFAVLHWGLAIQPAMFFVGLVGMSERAAQLLGKFPEPFINDPYLFGQNDLIYQNWIRFTNIFSQLTFICLIPWFSLTALTLLFHRRYWSKEESRINIILYRFLPICIYILSFLIILFDPAERFSWFLD